MIQSPIPKLALLAVAGASTYASMTPPNPPAKASEKTGRKTLFESGVLWVTWLTKTSFGLSVSLDALSILTTLSRPHLMRAIEASTMSTTFLVGVAMLFLSAVLRKFCYRALGHLFTFEVTIRAKHKLVKSGPYSWVRHPSYVGIYGTLIGSTMVILSRGSFMRELLKGPLRALQSCNPPLRSFSDLPTYALCAGNAFIQMRFTEHLALAALSLWLSKVIFALLNVNKRMNNEDNELRKTFGDEWERYARQVRYKVFPGVF